MKAEKFIASRLGVKAGMAITAIAISFFVIIIAMSVSSGFRSAISNGISQIAADVQLYPDVTDFFSDRNPVSSSPSYLEDIKSVNGVTEVTPVIYRAGIIKKGELIRAVLFKGKGEGESLVADVPAGLAEELGLGEGDSFLAYFTSSKVKIRKITVGSVGEERIDTGEEYIVGLPISDLRRLNGWEENEASGFEIMLGKKFKNPRGGMEKASEIAYIAETQAKDEDEIMGAKSAAQSFSHIFSWLEVIDFNVLVILILMILVAGFNMISGLLILLFRNISTIGTLKSLGMTDRGVAGVFLRISAKIVGKGMLIGNATALLLCLIQSTTHFLKLDPANYYVSYVPVEFDLLKILACDAVAFAVILLLMLIPCLFISRIDPSLTSKTE